ncbi:MAG TPA: HEAT repeat domain-containing protein [Candidatus Binatia bacterium]|nr:HEAT repeat domain-containing protein [Candidatus Binatia bacterium]
MSSSAITHLAIGTLALGLLALVSCIALVIHHAVSEALHRRRARRTDEALVLLVGPIISGDDLCAVTAEAVRRFGRGPVAEVLRRARIDIAGERADGITAALDSMGEIDRLRRRARSRSATRRRTAVRHLGECGGDGARDALAEALGDREWEVRRAARDGLLADRRRESIRAALESYLAEPATNLGWRRSFYARFALVAPDQLCELLRETTLGASEEKLALEALGHARAEAAIPEARARLAAEDSELRASAARFLGKLRDHESAPSLVRLLDDPEWFVRAAAARGLENLPKTADVLDALGRSLNDESWWVRSNAARTLSREAEPGFEILRRAIDGDDAYARDAALAALATVRVTTVHRRAETAERPGEGAATC